MVYDWRVCWDFRTKALTMTSSVLPALFFFLIPRSEADLLSKQVGYLSGRSGQKDRKWRCRSITCGWEAP